MAVDSESESAAQIGGNVVFRPAGDNGIAEYPPGITQCLVGNGQRAPFLHPSEHGQQFPRRDGVDGTFTDVRKEIFLQDADDRFPI